MFPSMQSSFDGVLDNYSYSNGFETKEGRIVAKKSLLYGIDNWEGSKDIHSFCSDARLYQDNTADEEFMSRYQRDQQVKLLSYFGSSDDLYLDVVSPPFQSYQEDITDFVGMDFENSEVIEPQTEKSSTCPLASFSLLKTYRSRFRPLKGEKINLSSYDAACTNASKWRLSTDAIIRLAGDNFIQSCSQRVDNLSMLGHPYASSLYGISTKETRDVELIEYLLATAEKVGQQQFDRARKILNHCVKLSSNKGNPVQRVAYYFIEALLQKIDQETGIIKSTASGEKQLFNLEEAVMSPRPNNISFHKEVPFSQVSQYTGMQAIVENVAGAKRIHLIDLVIMNGSHCIILMQALAARCECHIEHLTITAVGTKSKSIIEETGKRLMGFALSMNLPFSFNVVMVADMLDLSEDLFKVEAEETVAVHSSYLFSTMIAKPERLECLMRVIKGINPCVVVVTEVEANLNSPVFVNRFIEALFFYGALFDSLADCMDHDNPRRIITESVYFSQAIQNIVASEGEERTIRHVNINVWRAFFTRFRMVEIELSTSSLYQASLVVKQFDSWSSCTLEMNDRSLFIGWKGTPVHSLSAWKFL